MFIKIAIIFGIVLVFCLIPFLTRKASELWTRYTAGEGEATPLLGTIGTINAVAAPHGALPAEGETTSAFNCAGDPQDEVSDLDSTTSSDAGSDSDSAISSATDEGPQHEEPGQEPELDLEDDNLASVTYSKQINAF